jgi:WD40 repeat protein
VSGRPAQTTSSGLPSVLPGGIPLQYSSIQKNHPTNQPQVSSPTTPIPMHSPTIPNDNKIQFKQAEWSVSHNPNIKQSLQIDLVKTFNYTASVFCLKFSPDGKYLAVGLDRRSGKTYIYDVEKGVEIWLAPS